MSAAVRCSAPAAAARPRGTYRAINALAPAALGAPRRTRRAPGSRARQSWPGTVCAAQAEAGAPASFGTTPEVDAKMEEMREFIREDSERLFKGGCDASM